ncbi:uncharacterized protein RCH25_049140 [Pelodytes ibericus]
MIKRAVSMEVKTNTPEIMSILQSNILLDCHFVNAGHFKLEDIAVKWMVKIRNSSKTVYMFNGTRENCHRAGATLDLLLLGVGNASLHLHSITLEDEGAYTCTVLIAPHFSSTTVLMKVTEKWTETRRISSLLTLNYKFLFFRMDFEPSHVKSCVPVEYMGSNSRGNYCLKPYEMDITQPTVNLEPKNSHLLDGQTTTFFCDVSQFYPQDFKIIWLMKQVQGREATLTSNICTGIPSVTDNGTFTVSSQISLIFSERDSGAMYICEVRHESLLRPMRRNITVILADPQVIERDTGFIMGVVIGTVLVTGIASVAFVILYQKKFAKAAPLVSSLFLTELITANENMIGMCNINGFRPKTISIQWYIEKILASTASHSAVCPLLVSTDITSRAEHPVTKHGSIYNTTSQLSYTPTVADNGAILVCEVKHKALQAPITKRKMIKVTAKPKKSYITSWPLVPQLGKVLKISSIIEMFYPRQITLTWFKNGQLVTDATQFGPFPSANDYFSVWSQIELLPTKEDDGITYTCQINHDSLGKIEELSYEINIKGTPPEVQWITADPPDATVGENLLLRCEISNFSPIDITVDWFKNKTLLHSGVSNSPCISSEKGTHSMWSFLIITPQTEDDKSVFTCRVQHVALKNYEERSYTLNLSSCRH